ncbi:MAG: HEAT repeat domain-containing protein, partial [Myxococcales bacterium]|nr:HEAT repeat domain-containing protein [Myxococcales bacterium]
AESEAIVSELLAGSPPLRARYLALAPLGELARGGDVAAATRLTAAIARDPDWPVRARAAIEAKGIAQGREALAAAVRDPSPRVREAALAAVAAPPTPAAPLAAVAALKDPWSFVRAAAAGALGAGPPSGEADGALGEALHDPSARVRVAALSSLALHHASSLRTAFRERLDDRSEDADVRVAAALALGAVCDQTSLDRLTELARALGTPGAGEDERALALAAVSALGAIQPKDLGDRLAPLNVATSPPEVRAAVAHALAAHGACSGDMR